MKKELKEIKKFTPRTYTHAIISKEDGIVTDIVSLKKFKRKNKRWKFQKEDSF